MFPRYKGSRHTLYAVTVAPITARHLMGWETQPLRLPMLAGLPRPSRTLPFALRQTSCREQRSLFLHPCNPLIRVNPRFRQVFINSTNQHKSAGTTLVVAQLSLYAWRTINGIDAERNQRRPNSQANRNRFTDEQVAQ